MVQLWIDEDESTDAWELVEAADPRLRPMALLDAVLNNTDRKGGHIVPVRDGADVHLYGVDHGVCFSTDPKLRTVLWAWRDDRIEPVRARRPRPAPRRRSTVRSAARSASCSTRPRSRRPGARLDALLDVGTLPEAIARLAGRALAAVLTLTGYQRIAEPGTAGVWSRSSIRGSVAPRPGVGSADPVRGLYVRGGSAGSRRRRSPPRRHHRGRARGPRDVGSSRPARRLRARRRPARRHPARDRRPVRRRRAGRHPGHRPSGLARRQPDRRTVPGHRADADDARASIPARALARPTGSFVLLDHVELVARREPGRRLDRARLWPGSTATSSSGSRATSSSASSSPAPSRSSSRTPTSRRGTEPAATSRRQPTAAADPGAGAEPAAEPAPAAGLRPAAGSR